MLRGVLILVAIVVVMVLEVVAGRSEVVTSAESGRG